MGLSEEYKKRIQESLDAETEEGFMPSRPRLRR